MRWAGGNPRHEQYVDGLEQGDTVHWAEQRPVLAVSLVMACWIMIVFMIATAYGMLL